MSMDPSCTLSDKPLVLGSTSRYRRALLDRLRLTFLVDGPDCDETPDPDEAPSALVLRLSETKARSLMERYPHHLIIGSDQVADLDGEIVGKPGSLTAAEQQLLRQSGRSVVFRTGLCLLDSATGSCQLDSVTIDVKFRDLELGEVRRYVHADQPVDCAGSIKAEGLGVSLFESVTTTDATALVGLPLIRLTQMLRNVGVKVP